MAVRRTSGWSLNQRPIALIEALGINAAANVGMRKAAAKFAENWRGVLSGHGSGKLYSAGIRFFTTQGGYRHVVPIFSGGRSRAHRASAPGRPPAKDSKELARSVDWKEESFLLYRVGMGGRVGRIGRALEAGVNVPGSLVGRHPARNFKIAPRPHGRLALKKSADDMTSLLHKEFKVGVESVIIDPVSGKAAERGGF